jgi:hypothetical protein
MRSKQMLMGVALIGCLAATVTSGAYAQEANTTRQLNAHTGQRPNPSMRQGPSAQLNARASGNRTSANEESTRHGLANESRSRPSVRAEPREMRGEHAAYARISEERHGRGWRGERELYARAGVEDGYRRERWPYRDRAAVGAGVAASDYGYQTRRLYAYAPTYEDAYAARPYYSYAPGYNVAVTTGPYYSPGWNVAYASPYYDYAPGVSFGIGIGPVGIGVGPAWAW